MGDGCNLVGRVGDDCLRDAVADGIDTPALREFAGLGLCEGWVDSVDLLRVVFDELGLEFPDPYSDAARILALRAHCRTFLIGGIAESRFVVSLRTFVDYIDLPDAARDLVQLPDRVAGAGDGYDTEVPAGTAERLAREFLAATA